MINNRSNSTKAKVQFIEDSEMDALLAGWGIETVNERTATADFVPAEFDKRKVKTRRNDYRDDR